MGKITSITLDPSDPIFSEPLSRSHPLLERKKRLLEARLAAERECADCPDIVAPDTPA